MAISKVTAAGIDNIAAAVEGASDSNKFTDADHSKLNAIEASATADQTAAQIKAAVESASDSNTFTDADHSKLNAIEASATADQTDAQIRTAVEAASDSNVFTDADHSKLNAVEANATADQTAAQIKTALENGIDSVHYVDGSIDTAHIGNDQVTADKLANSINTDIATGPAALPKAGGTMTGNINLNDNVQARFGGDSDLKIYHDGSNSYIDDTGTGNLYIKSNADNYINLISAAADANLGFLYKDSGGTQRGYFLFDSEDYIMKFGTDAERMRIASNGKVGFGETNPDASIVHFKDNKGSAGDLWTQVGAGNNMGITLQNSSTTDNCNSVLYFKNDTDYTAAIGARFVSHSSNETELRFSTHNGTNARERLTIKGNGQVGIGRIPAALLHLQDTSPEIRFTYTGNSGFSYIKGGADNDLKFSTGTTTGTERMQLTGAGILNQFNGKSIQNGLATYQYTGSVNTSTSSFYVDVDVGNAGGGNVALVEAIFSHHGLSSYGCALMGWYVFYNGGYVGENTISDITTGNGGSWSVSGPANGTMRVTKNAGSYAGGGEWFVKVTTQVR